MYEAYELRQQGFCVWEIDDGSLLLDEYYRKLQKEVQEWEEQRRLKLIKSKWEENKNKTMHDVLPRPFLP